MNQPRIPLYKASIGLGEYYNIFRTLYSGQLARGPVVEKFEKMVAATVGRVYCVAMANATVALHVAVRYIADRGEVVITTPFSFVASANAGLYENKKIVFTDVEPDSKLMRPESLRILLEKHRGSVCCVIYVDIFGLLPGSMEIKSICAEYGVFLIEDASQAIGSSNNGVRVSDLGDLSVISFHENKQLTTGGEGGVILTDDQDIYNYAKSLRDQGRVQGLNWMEDMRLGYNYRMTEIQAAFGVAQINRLDAIISKRRQIVGWYKKYLNSCDIELPFDPDPRSRSWFVFPVVFKTEQTAKKVQISLEENQIGFSRNYFPPIYRLAPHQNAEHVNSDLIQDYYNCAIALPLYVGIRERDVKFICSIISESLQLMSSEELYDNMSEIYDEYADSKRLYHEAVNGCIIKSFEGVVRRSSNVKALWLDVGPAHGVRTQYIFEQLTSVVSDLECDCIESSDAMADVLENKECVRTVFRKKIDDFKSSIRYNLITCLFNVLGHIPDRNSRIKAIRNMYDMLLPGGVLVFDVNNRYNATHYGWPSVLRNIIKDSLGLSRGDFKLNLDLGGKQLRSSVHLFSKSELQYLLGEAGIINYSFEFIDYKTGEVVASQFAGQIVVTIHK